MDKRAAIDGRLGLGENAVARRVGREGSGSTVFMGLQKKDGHLMQSGDLSDKKQSYEFGGA